MRIDIFLLLTVSERGIFLLKSTKFKEFEEKMRWNEDQGFSRKSIFISGR